MAIVVELAANRYSHQITNLFLREPVNLAVLGIFVLDRGGKHLGRCRIRRRGRSRGAQRRTARPSRRWWWCRAWSRCACCCWCRISIMSLRFWSPINVIERISEDAYTTVLKARDGNIEKSQRRVESAIDELQDVARSAIQQSDRGIAIAAVDALGRLHG